MLERAAYKLLRSLPAETSHNLAKRGMRKGHFAPGQYLWTFKDGNGDQECGYHFLDAFVDNPLGLAAGFDKNGVLVPAIRDYGFGFIEVGSVTHLGSKGNVKPRLFRLPEGHLMNRMGLNGEPAINVAERLKKAKYSHILINIAKSNNDSVMGDDAILDILAAYRCLRGIGIGDVFNLSCPNTKDGRTFQHPDVAGELLAEVKLLDFKTPWGVKVGPNLNREELGQLVQVCEDAGCSFYVACNTEPYEHVKYGKGGLSGPELRASVLRTVRLLSRTKKPIIAVGGVTDGQTAFMYQQAGATMVEAYTGFVVGPNAGPNFAHKVLKTWRALVEGWQG